MNSKSELLQLNQRLEFLLPSDYNLKTINVDNDINILFNIKYD